MDTPDLTIAILQGIRADIGSLVGRFDKLETRFDKLETRFDKLETRFDRLESKVDRLESKFDRLEAKVTEHDARFDSVDQTLDAVRAAVQRCVTREEFAMTMRLNDERYERMHALIIENQARSTAAHQELQDTVHQILATLGQHGSLAARIDRAERVL